MAGSLHDGDDLTETHEINVTPFIDVMLVLLIIFMVAAPLATADINIDLPRSAGSAAQRPDQPIWLSVTRDLQLTLGDNAVAGLAELPTALKQATGGDMETRIFLRADQAASYGEVMSVMNALRDAGWTRIALVGLEGGEPAAAQRAPVTP